MPASDAVVRVLFESSPDCLKILDGEGRIEHMNAAGAALMEIADPRAWIGRSWVSLWPAESQALVAEAVAAAQRGASGQFEAFRPTVRGTPKWWSVTARPALDEDGRCAHIIVASRDVTDARRADQALRDSEDRFRSTFENAAVGIAHVATDGRWLRVNERICAITGYERDELITKTFQDITHPDDLDADVANVTRLLRGEADSYVREKRYLRKDGSVVWVNLTVSCTRHADGRVDYFIGVVEDITGRKQIEDDLRRAHDRVARVLASIADGLVVLDRHWVFTYVNEQGARTMRMRPEDLLGRCAWDVFPFAVGTRFEVSLRRAVASGRPVHFDEYYPEPLNLWLGCTCYPSDEGLSVYFRDVSERKRVEAADRQNAALFATLVEQAPMGVYVVDAQFRLRQVNSEAMPTFKQVHPLIGRDFTEVMEVLWGPELGPQLSAIFRRTLASGERYVSPPFVEQRHDLGEEEAYEWETQRVTLPDGQFGVVCYFHNVTARVRADQALRASEERARLATESTGVGIWEWHLRTDQVRWDAATFRIYGIPPTASGLVSYDTWRDAVLPDDLPACEAVLQETIRTGGQSRRAFRIRRASDGQVRYIQAGEACRAGADGRAEWIVGTNLDVTDHWQAEARLRELTAELSEADRRKDVFLATLAHELRNPLAPLRSDLQILKRVAEDREAIEQTRLRMERQLTQMVRLVDDLMDVSRISQDKLALQPERVRLAAVVQSAVDSSRPLIDQMAQTLIVTLPEDPLEVDADPMRLAQVFANLLNNASKYSERGGRIELSVERRAEEVVVAVRDGGIGIAAEHLPRLFEMFAQVDHTKDRAQGGLGIGLHLVKRLVEMHGGRVSVHSDGAGRGSAFIVRLPLAPRAPVVRAPAAERASETAPPRYRILVADDNQDAVTSLALWLTHLGHDVRTAEDGASAVALAEAFAPDVILMDIGMPHLDGYDACRRIRSGTVGQRAVLIALTGWGQAQDKRRAREAGFDHHLVKPVDPIELEGLFRDRKAAQN